MFDDMIYRVSPDDVRRPDRRSMCGRRARRCCVMVGLSWLVVRCCAGHSSRVVSGRRAVGVASSSAVGVVACVAAGARVANQPTRERVCPGVPRGPTAASDRRASRRANSAVG